MNMMVINIAGITNGQEVEGAGNCGAKREIKGCCDTYKSNCEGMFTIKMHILAVHVSQQLDEYGTVGGLSEDLLESIIAIVNSFAKIYCMVQKQQRAGIVF